MRGPEGGGQCHKTIKTLNAKERMLKDSAKIISYNIRIHKKSSKSLKKFPKIHVFTPFHVTYKIHLDNLTVVLAIKFHSKVKFDSYEVMILSYSVLHFTPTPNLQKKNRISIMTFILYY